MGWRSGSGCSSQTLKRKKTKRKQGKAEQIKEYVHDSVVVENQAFQPWQVGKVVNLADFIVGKVDGVKLVQSSSQILDDGNLVVCKELFFSVKIFREINQGS